MDIDWIVKIGTPLAGVLVAMAGSIIAVLTLLQKRRTHRIELAEKLYQARESNSKLLAMEVFSQLFGLRYQYSDIEILSEDNDALQRLTMLKRRRDAVTFFDGEYSFHSTHQGRGRTINLLVHKFFMWSGFVLVIGSLAVVLLGSISGKFFPIFIVLTVLSALMGVYSGNELYWYKEADKILQSEKKKLSESDLE